MAKSCRFAVRKSYKHSDDRVLEVWLLRTALSGPPHLPRYGVQGVKSCVDVLDLRLLSLGHLLLRFVMVGDIEKEAGPPHEPGMAVSLLLSGDDR